MEGRSQPRAGVERFQERNFQQAGRRASLQELAVGPADGLSARRADDQSKRGAATIVYIISDFRAKDWAAGSDLHVKAYRALTAAASPARKLQLIDCVDAERPNLVISALKPGLGIRAAGVPLKIEVAVTNYGQQTAHDVSIELQEDGKSRPAITIASIPAGKTAAGDFEVRYANAGQHTIMAKLPSDAVETDNTRYSALKFPESVPVLVIAGDGQSATKKGDAYFLTLPFSSNNIAPTGIAPRIESPRFLREKPLDPFHVIYLLDVDRLDQTEIDALEKYVAAGGGVAFFMGDRSRADFYNSRLYRDGKGIFPAPLVGPTELLVDRTETPSDLTVEGNHPVFSLFASQPNVDIDKVVVEPLFLRSTRTGHRPRIRRLAWSPGSATARPLVIERTMGERRVIAFLTTAAPTWNNLARTPRHIGAMLQMAAYLSAAKQTDPGREVGGPLEVEFDPAKYRSQIKFVIPARGRAENLAVEATPSSNNLYKAVLPGDAMRSGIYEVQLTAHDPRGAVYRRAADDNAAQTGRRQKRAAKPADDKASRQTRRPARRIAPFRLQHRARRRRSEDRRRPTTRNPARRRQLPFPSCVGSIYRCRRFRSGQSQPHRAVCLDRPVGVRAIARLFVQLSPCRQGSRALMFVIPSFLFADAAAPASVAAAVRYQFTQPQSFSEWWQMPLLVLACLAVMGFVAYMYYRDSVELRPGVGVFLAIMRITAFAGLLLFFLDLQKWSEQKEIQNSRALVLVDTSISMGLGNADLSGSSPADTRIAQVVSEFTAGKMLSVLQKTHDVEVWRFDQDLSRAASLFPKIQDVAVLQQLDAEAIAARDARAEWLRYGLIAAAAILVLSLLGFVIGRLLLGRRTGGWFFGLGATLSAMAIFGGWPT